MVVSGLGAFAVTLGINVPLNDALAAATPTRESAAQLWQDYAGRWTLWNHVRAVASIVAFGLLAAAVVIALRDTIRGLRILRGYRASASRLGRTARPCPIRRAC